MSASGSRPTRGRSCRGPVADESEERRSEHHSRWRNVSQLRDGWTLHRSHGVLALRRGRTFPATRLGELTAGLTRTAGLGPDVVLPHASDDVGPEHPARHLPVARKQPVPEQGLAILVPAPARSTGPAGRGWRATGNGNYRSTRLSLTATASGSPAQRPAPAPRASPRPRPDPRRPCRRGC